MQTPGALERTAYELAEDSAAENIRYLEVRYSPVLHTERGMSLEEAVSAPLQGLARAEAEFGIRTGLIICGIRTHGSLGFPGSGRAGRGVHGPGRGGLRPGGGRGREPGQGAPEGLPVRGRATTWPSPSTPVKATAPTPSPRPSTKCHARRIGHGTRLLEDPALERFVNDFRIPLEVCLTSNVQTRVAPTFAEHPLRRYFDAGLVVTLNTDNRLLSGTTLTDEYWLAHQHLGFGWEELTEVALLGFQAAFLPYEAKVNLLEEVEGEMRRL